MVEIVDRLDYLWNRGVTVAFSHAWHACVYAWVIGRIAVRHWRWTLLALLLYSPTFFFRLVLWLLSWSSWMQQPWLSIFPGLPEDPPPAPKFSFTFPVLGYSPLEVGLAMYGLSMTLILLAVIMKPKRVVRVCEHGFMVERSVTGSVPITTPCPDFIGVVFVERDGNRHRSGTFFRVGNHLYTAGHVVLGASKVWFVYKGQELLVTGTPSEIDTDLYRYAYEPFSSFQMGAGKFVKRTMPAYCQVHNGDSQTYGRVSAADVGFVQYTGTTLPGFSGAPYYSGRQVYGLHIGGGVLNLGYDGAHIAALNQYLRPESAENPFTDPRELLDEMREKGEALEYRLMPNEVYQVRIGGRYQIYDEETFDRTFANYKRRMASGPDYSEESAGAQPAAFTYQDSENAEGPAACATQVAGPFSAVEGLALGMEKLTSSMITVLSRLENLEKSHTAGPKRPIVPQSEASVFTSESPTPSVSNGQPKKKKARSGTWLSHLTVDQLKQAADLFKQLPSESTS